MSNEPYVEVSEIKRLIEASEKYHKAAKGSRNQLYLALTEAYRWQRLAKHSPKHAGAVNKLIEERLGDVKEKSVKHAETFVSIIKATVLYEPKSNERELFKNVDQLTTTYSRALEYCARKEHTAEETYNALISEGVVALKNKLKKGKGPGSGNSKIDPIELAKSLPAMVEFETDGVSDYGNGLGVFLASVDDQTVSILRQLPSLQDKILDAVKGVLLKDALNNSDVGLFVQPINLATRFIATPASLELQLKQTTKGITLYVRSRKKFKWAKAITFESARTVDAIANQKPYAMSSDQIKKLAKEFKRQPDPTKWILASNKLQVGSSNVVLEVNNTRIKAPHIKDWQITAVRDLTISQQDWLKFAEEIRELDAKSEATVNQTNISFGDVSVPFASNNRSRKTLKLNLTKSIIKQLARTMREIESPVLRLEASATLANYSVASPAGTYGIVV